MSDEEHANEGIENLNSGAGFCGPNADAAGADHSAAPADDMEKAGDGDIQSAGAPGAEALSKIAGRLDELGGCLDEANRISRERERIIDRLHQENQQLRGGELQQAMTPVYRDLIRLHDDLLQTSRRYLAQSAASDDEAARDFQSYSDAVMDVLYRYGVERYEAAEGAPFNPKEHRAVAAIPTTDGNLDRAIAKVIRFGFRTETRIVRLLEAEVYRATPAEQARDASPNQQDQSLSQTTDVQ
jgi:molecular chaperone GrpE (heat shock protein)